MSKQQSPNSSNISNDEKTTHELIIQYASRVYEHQANEPQFDCTMVDIGMTDMLDLLEEYANQKVTASDKRIMELIEGRIKELQGLKWASETRDVQALTDLLTYIKEFK